MSKELTLTRTFDAPRDLVFKAWIDPKLMAKWWSPYGFANPVCELDARPGGAIRLVMRGPDANEYPMTGVIQEIDEPRRLVFTTGAVHDEKDVAQLETLNTVTFAEAGGKTEITLHIVVVKASPAASGALAGMEMGWNQSLEKLNYHLGHLEDKKGMEKFSLIAEPGNQEVVVSHVFDAPRDLVFKAVTDPNLIPQWWGPKYLTTTVDRMELRPGGVWRFVQRDAGGKEYAFHGVYHEIRPPEQLVYTFEFEGFPGHVSLETVTFTEQDGKTTFNDQTVFQSVMDRDGMLYSGMEIGVADSMERLTGLLVKV